jgi:hypothetical protein
MKHWGMSPTSVTTCLQTKEVHRNHNLQCHTHIQKAENREVSLKLSLILRELLIALHMI